MREPSACQTRSALGVGGLTWASNLNSFSKTTNLFGANPSLESDCVGQAYEPDPLNRGRCYRRKKSQKAFASAGHRIHSMTIPF